MVKCDIQPYCENCPNFDADAEKIYFGKFVDTYIRCTHDNQCRRLMDYLKNYKEKKDDQGTV